VARSHQRGPLGTGEQRQGGDVDGGPRLRIAEDHEAELVDDGPVVADADGDGRRTTWGDGETAGLEVDDGAHACGG
jgi:hypothetical protein